MTTLETGASVPTFSDAKWILIGIATLALVVTLTWMGIALHNRATTITALNASLDTANVNLKNSVAIANQNAADAALLKKQMIDNEAALKEKNDNNVKLATDLARLQSEVSHAKPTVCLPSAIIAMVDGLRNLQTGSAAGAKNPGGAPDNSGGTANHPATTPGAADQLIAHWIGQMFEHDSICAENIQQISKLQAGATP